MAGSLLLSACAPTPVAMPGPVYEPYPGTYSKSAPIRRPPVARPPAMTQKPVVTPLDHTLPLPEQTPPEVEVLQVPEVTDTQEAVVDTEVKRPVRNYPSSAPVQILLKQAQGEAGQGKLGVAEATLERALRIEPENPGLWLKLSELKRQQGDTAQAEAMAAKAAYYQESLN